MLKNMEQVYFYTVFRISWGYFGLCSTEKGIFRTCLPVKTKPISKEILTKGLKNPIYKKSLLLPLQKKISAYYKGTYVDFSDVAVDLSGHTPFSQKVLLSCINITYGKTKTYKELAELVGHPQSARAVGGVMAHNRIPLIIPCNRVLGSDGSLHGFSAPGGIETKKKMLLLEKTLSLGQ